MTNELPKASPLVTESVSMPCPCCGAPAAMPLTLCESCGARQVDQALSPPDRLLPSLGPAIGALIMPLSALVFFALMWVFGNDMKVGRALLAHAFGDRFKLTRDLLRLDPALPYYRIFSYDAMRLAFFLSLALIPLSMLGVWLARRARRRIRENPVGFGGWRMATTGLALSLVMLLGLSGAAISQIPQALEMRRERQAAATRAAMYQVARQLREFNHAHGRFPSDMAELQAFTREHLPQTDYWEIPLAYTPAALLASRENTASGFSDYKLVSAGHDGLPGTPDDIVLQNGIILSGPPESDLPGDPAPASKVR
ncbi:MAG: hypothetical protein ACKV2V_11130 [Blastocatellia bacterium]